MSRTDGTYSVVDATSSPPRVTVPRDYNASVDFVDRHVAQGRGSRIAFRDDRGDTTFGALATRTSQIAHTLRALGVRMEERVVLCMLDTADFPATFFGVIKLGAVAVPLNTLLTADDWAFMLESSRARVVVVSDALHVKLAPAIAKSPFVEHVIVAKTSLGASGFAGEQEGNAKSYSLDALLSKAPAAFAAAPTCADDAAFWLFSSGSTGAPKGAVHLHSDLVWTAALYGSGVLGMREDDVVFSAAKLFFAYGLGNAMTFPLHVGATSVLLAERPTPAAVMRVLREKQPTIFGGVPTLFASILADAANDRASGSRALRACISAGEALPKHLGEKWKERFGVDILDGIGSTEMLHIFLSNRHDDVRYGTTGKPVPGYDVKLVGEDGEPVRDGEEGALWVRGTSCCVAYFNQRAKSLATFHGEWTKTGDTYVRDGEGYYTYSGRSDDMLKVGGIWVSPFEIESALSAHPRVLEAAVVGKEDAEGLVKPKAFVVVHDPRDANEGVARELQAFVKARLAHYKYPRWVDFVAELPKTATGKIQRFRLRGM